MIKQKYSSEEHLITIEEDEEQYFYALKDRIPLYCALNIKVYKKIKGNKKEYIGSYSKSWDNKTSSNAINMFIKNFLEKPIFRKDFLSDGNGFNAVIPYSDEKGINKRCKEVIKNFYSKNSSKRRFKDYAMLKTYGFDKFSRLKISSLEQLVQKKDFELAKTAFDDDKLVASTLKWCCRGLLIDDAIRKVKTDLEITNNAFR